MQFRCVEIVSIGTNIQKLTKSHFGPISPLKLQCKTSKWWPERVTGSIVPKKFCSILYKLVSLVKSWRRKEKFLAYLMFTYKQCILFLHCRAQLGGRNWQPFGEGKTGHKNVSSWRVIANLQI